MRAELEDSVGNQHLAQILCGDMAADQIQRAFFGVCNERYNPNESDLKVGKAIRKKVVETIEFRNSLAHGDWDIGTHDGEGTTYPPTLLRVRPGSSGNQWRNQQLEPSELDQKSDELEVLRHDIFFYGHTAGGFMFQGHGHRPSDVFVIRDGTAIRAGTVKFEGHVS